MHDGGRQRPAAAGACPWPGPRAKQGMHQLATAGAGKVVKSVPDTRPACEREAAIFSS